MIVHRRCHQLALVARQQATLLDVDQRAPQPKRILVTLWLGEWPTLAGVVALQQPGRRRAPHRIGEIGLELLGRDGGETLPIG